MPCFDKPGHAELGQTIACRAVHDTALCGSCLRGIEQVVIIVSSGRKNAACATPAALAPPTIPMAITDEIARLCH